jgi:DNA-binding CsgD family transcriptional regulator
VAAGPAPRAGVITRPGAPLVERAGELTAVARALDETALGSGRCVVLEGPGGIGKTAVLDAAGDYARAAGARVLAARGDELEREFPFGVARQLLEPVVHDGDGSADPALLAGPARLAGVLLGVGTGAGQASALPAGPDAPGAALHALHWLVANLSRRGPLAIIVDDTHCADLPSLRLLAYLATRVPRLPVAVLVALRLPLSGAAEAVVAALRRARQVVVLRPRPLSAAGSARVVGRLAPDASGDDLRAIHEAAAGNPLLLEELALALRDDPGGGPGAAAERVAETVWRRIADGPAGSAAFARAVAVLGRGVELRHAAAIAGLAPREAAAAADALAAAGVLAAGRPLDFRHPLLRVAVAAQVPIGERTAAHADAARLLAAEDAPPERIAAHLLATEPHGDAWVAERLIAAGGAAAARAAPEAAVRFLRRALAEPPPPERRAALLLELGAAEVAAFELPAAEEHLRRGLVLVTDPEARLRFASLLASVLSNDGRADEAVDVLDGALRGAEGADPALIASVEANLVNIARNQVAARRRARSRAAAVGARVAAGADAALPLLATAAAELAMAGTDAARCAALAERALRGVGAAWDTLEFWPWVAARCLVVADRPEPARRALDAAVDRAQARGSVYQLRVLLVFRAELAYRTGDVAATEADARGALERVDEHGWTAGVPFAAALLVLALLERGDHAAAAALLRAQGLAGAGPELPDLHTNHLLLHARGRLRVEQGDLRAGLEDLLECGRRERELDEPNPAVLDWRSQAALALVATGQPEAAGRLAREELALAGAFGAPRAIGIAQRALGLVVGGSEGLELLRASAATLAGSPARLEHARALADLGAALRRVGFLTDARAALRRALELAHECHAGALEERALTELQRAGGRPRRIALSGRDALTPSERRIAELAAAGHPNREIAARLYLSVRTVEFHLSGAYRKLGVGSRRGLPAALVDAIPPLVEAAGGSVRAGTSPGPRY